MRDLKTDGWRRYPRPSDLDAAATKDIAAVMSGILADPFALSGRPITAIGTSADRTFVTTTCCSMSRVRRSFAMTDPIAERIRKVGGSALKFIGHVWRPQRLLDNDADYVESLDMLAELRGITRRLPRA